MKYMRRVSAELETVCGQEEEELIVQGVRFAFRVHQVKKHGDQFIYFYSTWSWKFNGFGLMYFDSLPVDLMLRRWGLLKSYVIKQDGATSSAKTNSNRNLVLAKHSLSVANSASAFVITCFFAVKKEMTLFRVNTMDLYFCFGTHTIF